MAYVVVLLLLPLLYPLTTESSSSPGMAAKPGCQTDCGGVLIPYPFGIGTNCSRPLFNITCNTTAAATPKPFLGTGNVEVLEILPTAGLLRIKHYLAYDCYRYQSDGNYYDNYHYNVPSITLSSPPFTFSTRNKFVAIGCDTVGHIRDSDDRFETGCLSVCNSTRHVLNGTCAGVGCCEAPIPEGLTSFSMVIDSYKNHSDCAGFNPCSYAFLADEDNFTFATSNFSDLRLVEFMPVTVDWAIGNLSCEQEANKTDFACASRNSYCYNSTNGPGYRCNCSQGYQGNPYLADGCQDINECETNNPCAKRCRNTAGNYSCSCPWGMYGDGTNRGSGCRSIWIFLYVTLGGGFGLLFVIVAGSWLYWISKKRRLIELKEKFFRQNGGFLMQQQISSPEGSAAATRMFTSEELESATKNYDESKVLGRGGSAKVYKGILSDNKEVAIKKSKIASEGEIEQFINEVVVLSHTSHRNVVKLLGCCLETRVPLLVYEFVPNGTLYHHIHDEGLKSSLSLANRMRIAAETAGALAYLHSAASMPIIHRDVKSTNILLDDNYAAKVSDFGVSRLVPFDQNGLPSLVRGTFGYLDPEYFYTTKFTDKSDVYSFGVVLLELLTGEKPVMVIKGGGSRNLASHFLSCLEENRLDQILEDRVIDEGSTELLAALAELARRCLKLKGDERPTMKEVAMELEGMRRFEKHPWVKGNEEEEECLLGEAELSAPDVTFSEGDSSTLVMLPFNILR